jgi:2'-5' RNA ligase
VPRPNWFFAFPVDGAFVLGLPATPASIRRFVPEDVHLTLAFLGGCGEEAALRALAVLDARLASAPPPVFQATLGEVVPMGSARRYTALSALLSQGRAEVAACLTDLGGVLCEAAILRRPSRPAKPHVTLARPRARASEADRQAGLDWARKIALGGVEVRLDRIALYTWNDRRHERLFKIAAERTLAATQT